jgi:ornithine cyclodeaminase/alanine dehydrogenase-like protein (mu-crystallin family)
MPVLHLNEDEVARLLDTPRAIDLMHEAFRRLASGEAHNVPRVRARGQGIVLHSMCAAADYLGLAGWKEYTTTRHGARFHVGLYDQQSGELIALLEANRLGQMRTGAVTGLAVRLMAPERATEAGLFGSGWQAESQLAAAHAALQACGGLSRAFVYSRDQQKRRRFAERMSAALGMEVIPVEEPRLAVEGRPIVVTATSSREPVFDGGWLSPGALVCAMGSNWLNKAEIDRETVRCAAAVVCDSVEACRHEAGDFAASLAHGEFDWQRAIELADVAAGKIAIRAGGTNTVIFKSVGLALEDVALGADVLHRARAAGLGRELPI